VGWGWWQAQAQIFTFIMEELGFDTFKEETRAYFVAEIRKLADQGAQAPTPCPLRYWRYSNGSLWGVSSMPTRRALFSAAPRLSFW